MNRFTDTISGNVIEKDRAVALLSSEVQAQELLQALAVNFRLNFVPSNEGPYIVVRTTGPAYLLEKVEAWVAGFLFARHGKPQSLTDREIFPSAEPEERTLRTCDRCKQSKVEYSKAFPGLCKECYLRVWGHR